VRASGSYRVRAVADDACRVKIAGTTLIDTWSFRLDRPSMGETRLSKGWHDVEVDFLEIDGVARIELQWSRDGLAEEPISSSDFRVDGDTPGLQGTYYARVDFLPEDGAGRAHSALRELGIGFIIKPPDAPHRVEERLGLRSSSAEGQPLLFAIPGH